MDDGFWGIRTVATMQVAMMSEREVRAALVAALLRLHEIEGSDGVRRALGEDDG